MARELEELVVDARALALQAKESDSRLDEMLRRANLISGKLTCTREYQRDVEKILVATGKADRRRGLLEDLQRENRMIKSYEEENSMLKDQLEKSYATVDEIVARHRQIMTRVQSEQTLCHLSPAMLQKILDSEFSCDVMQRNEHVEQAQRLMDVMRYCEVVAQRDTELFARVVKENRNLRELLNYAAISDPHIIAHFRKSMAEYDKEQKARRARQQAENGQPEGSEEEEEGEEDADTSVLFNRSNLSQSTAGNATMRLATPPGRGAVEGAGSKRKANGAADELAARADDVLAGIDELSEESDAETVMGREDEGEEEEEAEGDISAAPLITFSPPTKKETDADSGTASSLSSSPASSSDGDSVSVESPASPPANISKQCPKIDKIDTCPTIEAARPPRM